MPPTIAKWQTNEAPHTDMSNINELWQHPLAYDPLSDWGYIRDGREHLIARVREFSLTMEEEREHRAKRTDPTKPRAERIVSCVNACVGIPDPAAAIQAAREALTEAHRYMSSGLKVTQQVKKALDLLTPNP